MLFSSRWLARYVELPETTEDLVELLTRCGMVVEDMRPQGDGTVFDIDIPSNRVDAMNHYGVAREIATARRVDPRHPSIATVERQMELLTSSKRDVYSLERDGVAAREVSVSRQLQRIGFEAKTRDALCVITARSDPEGRWIYQQLAASPGEKRVRAEIEIGTPPSVELRYLPPEPRF